MMGVMRDRAMPGAHPYLLPPRRPDTLRLHMIFQEGKSSLGGKEITTAPLIQVKLQSGQESLFRLSFRVKQNGLVALCFMFLFCY